MTELVLSCPRFMRNLSSWRAGCILCPPQIPTLTVHWLVIGLGDTGRHCPPLHVIHWAKPSRGQDGQLLDNQFFPFLIRVQVYQAFVFSVNLYRPAFAKIFLSCSLIFSNISLYFIQTHIPFILTSAEDMLYCLFCIEINLTFNLKCFTRFYAYTSQASELEYKWVY